MKKRTLIDKYDAMVRKSANHCFTLEKNLQVLQTTIQKNILQKKKKKKQKTVVLKTLIQNANILPALEKLPTI